MCSWTWNLNVIFWRGAVLLWLTMYNNTFHCSSFYDIFYHILFCHCTDLNPPAVVGWGFTLFFLCFLASEKAAIVCKGSLIDPSGVSFLFCSWWRHSLSAHSALGSLCLWACEMSQSAGRAPSESHWRHLENLYEYVLKVLFFGDRLYASLPQMPSFTLAGVLFCNLVQVWLKGIFRVFLFSSTNVRVFASAGPVLQV